MKILAVDDDPIILELLEQLVESHSEHELTTATSGADALSLISTGLQIEFDCFLFDIQMPQMDGIELTKTVREFSNHIDTPILMLTAMSDKRYIDGAFTAGATDYVTKPFDVAELIARLRLIQELVNTRKSKTKKIFATQNLSTQDLPATAQQQVELYDPISIYDVDNVIDYPAMENYARQLARGSLFGSTTFAFNIRKIADHHAKLSGTEFAFMVCDVAEVLSDVLVGHQFLMTYAGNGTFICVTESGWRPDMQSLMDQVNLALSRTELFDNAGQHLFVRVSAGECIRLIWRSESSVMEAISTACASAENASVAHENSMNNLWLVQERA